MIKNFAVVNELGDVVNVIVIDDADADSILAFNAIPVPDGLMVAIGWKYDGMVFSAPVIERTLDEVLAQKIRQINSACSAEIVSGFTSVALGASHHYTASLEDQANLLGLAVIGVGGEFTCTDVVGVKARRYHTSAELQMVLADGGAIKDSCLAKARMLKDVVLAASDVAAVDAVVW